MFKKTFLGDYFWEITRNISIHFVGDSYRHDIYNGEPTTTVIIDEISYPLRGDLREAFEKTGGNLKKIRDVYLQNIKKTKYNVPKGKDHTPLIRVFTNHINQYIK